MSDDEIFGTNANIHRKLSINCVHSKSIAIWSSDGEFLFSVCECLVIVLLPLCIVYNL